MNYFRGGPTLLQLKSETISNSTQPNLSYQIDTEKQHTNVILKLKACKSVTFNHKQTSQWIQTPIGQGKTSMQIFRCNPIPYFQFGQRIFFKMIYLSTFKDAFIHMPRDLTNNYNSNTSLNKNNLLIYYLSHLLSYQSTNNLSHVNLDFSSM